MMNVPTSDPWTMLRRHTPARIALGRAGSSLPTRELLDFSLAHAAARDAVHSVLDVERVESDLRPLGLAVVGVETRAADRQSYLHRPDLGRRLSEESRGRLEDLNAAAADVAVTVADGLSALAAQRHAPTLLAILVPVLRSAGVSLSPITVVTQSRVAVQDEIGALLRARCAVILIGERPGLGSADSLGAYLVFGPRVGRTDAERNCVSNIRPEGLSPAAAAETLAYLISESLRRRLSGVGLKDERGALPAAAVNPRLHE
jgi:ethanolamine ammonia-lyase small subunit